LFSCPHYV